jgi:heme-degrading monooxygenase HmoA
MYIIVWEFIVRAEHRYEFESVYGSNGEWARLFAASADYRQTQLLRDLSDPLRYVTLDFWGSRAAHDRFRQEQAKEYNVLDERCERLTVTENKLGEFESS